MTQPKNIVSSSSDYEYKSNEAEHTHDYLKQPILTVCHKLNALRVLDIGCGTGALCRDLHSAGFEVTGCDPSESGIRFARESLPEGDFKLLGIYDDPQDLRASGFDVAISTEVVEHLFYPRYLPRFASHVLKSDGYLILSTPYHGYLKNLLLSLFNKWDFHHTPLWDGGHVKFWSKATLSQMLTQEGFRVSKFIGVGRIPFLWKSMIIVARKTSE